MNMELIQILRIQSLIIYNNRYKQTNTIMKIHVFFTNILFQEDNIHSVITFTFLETFFISNFLQKNNQGSVVIVFP